MAVTLAVLPGEWDEVILRGDGWVRPFQVPGDYSTESGATWLLRARVNAEDPFIQLDESNGITAVYDPVEIIDGVTGWTTVTFTLTAEQTLELELTTATAKWAIQSTLDAVPKTWFAGDLSVQQTAIVGAS